ncbi:MAG: 50S ribosomal protein L24 [Candidatus Bathyarchaeia archaeon]
MRSKPSTRPGKQRLVRYTAHSWMKHKFLAAPLSTELRTTYGRRSIPVRAGDSVRIVRGDFSGVEGKVSDVDTARQRLFVEGVTREKVAGTSEKVSVHCTKVMITKLNLDDKWRAESLKEKKATIEKAEAE